MIFEETEKPGRQRTGFETNAAALAVEFLDASAYVVRIAGDNALHHGVSSIIDDANRCQFHGDVQPNIEARDRSPPAKPMIAMLLLVRERCRATCWRLSQLQ